MPGNGDLISIVFLQRNCTRTLAGRVHTGRTVWHCIERNWGCEPRRRFCANFPRKCASACDAGDDEQHRITAWPRDHWGITGRKIDREIAWDLLRDADWRKRGRVATTNDNAYQRDCGTSLQKMWMLCHRFLSIRGRKSRELVRLPAFIPGS